MLATTLADTLAGHFAHLSIDGWAGAVVAVFILKAGWGAAEDTINPLLGASPDPELVHAIREVVLSHPQVVGMHDLIIHDYGPGRRLCSFHAEVPQDADILEAHDAIDHIEREIQQRTEHRQPLYAKRRYENDEKIKEELTREIDRQTASLRQLRKERALCKRIEQQVPGIQQNLREFEENNSGVGLFYFDSDEDVFCVYSQYIDDLMMLAKMIRAACADEKTMGMYLNMSEVVKA